MEPTGVTPEQTKVCTKCDETKPLFDYYRDASKAGGYRNDCKVCVLNRQKAYGEANRDKRIAYMRTYNQANREQVNAKNKARHAERYATDSGYREQFYAAATRRKRMLASAKSEPYTRESIFERDVWVCQLCDESIDPEVRWPDSRSASIDHIVPVSLGGDDTPENVQAAHYGCNAGRGIKPIDQVA